MNRLRVSGIDRGVDCELLLLVDGRDVLAPMDARGLDPDAGLPLLAPLGVPRRVQLGRCGCDDGSCGEVSVRVASADGVVVWDQWRSSLGFDVPAELRFESRRYAEEVRAAADDRPWESPERRYARRAAALVDADVRAALAWRGLHLAEIVPAADGAVAVRLTAAQGGGRWSVFVVLPVTEDPDAVCSLLRRRGPTAWPDVYWWGENEAAAFQQPPMAGRRWRMWQPTGQ